MKRDESEEHQYRLVFASLAFISRQDDGELYIYQALISHKYCSVLQQGPPSSDLNHCHGKHVTDRLLSHLECIQARGVVPRLV